MKIKRYLLQSVRDHLDSKEITVITGARQVGKTTLIQEVEKELHARQKKTLYLNLDFEPDFRYFESHELFIQKLNLEFGKDYGYLFIDEIQRKKNAGLFLKGLYDRNLPVKFIVTGSGSMELKAKIHESLAGRKRIFELLPVTFDEFVQFKTNYRYEQNLSEFYKLETTQTALFLAEYLSYGGYPRIITESVQKEKFSLMNEIFNSYLSRDISYLLNLDRPDAFKKLVRLLGVQTGNPLNYSTLANDSGLSVPTLKKYIWYQVNTFITKEISPFFKNKRKEITKSPVIYFNDSGFRNFLLNRFGVSDNITDGMTFQNFIFNLLYDYTMTNPPCEIHYWRTIAQAEVDFVLIQANSIIPVEVKYSHLKNTKITKSLVSFIEKYKPERVIIVNLSLSEIREIKSAQIEFVPFYELLNVLKKGLF